MCRPDDTWLEEMDFTYSELNAIRKKAGTWLKQGERYNMMECGVFVCWKQSSNIVMYAPNLPRIFLMNKELTILEKHFPYLLNWKKEFVNSEIPSCEIAFSPLTIGKTLVPYQYTTQEIIQLKKQRNSQKASTLNFSSKSEKLKEKSFAKKEKEVPLIVLPFDTPSFANLWQKWKDYLSKKRQYIYPSKEEQEMLMLLGNYNEEFANLLIAKAIQKGWKNFHFPNTADLFKQKNNTHEHKHKTFKSTADPVAEKILRELSR